MSLSYRRFLKFAVISLVLLSLTRFYVNNYASVFGETLIMIVYPVSFISLLLLWILTIYRRIMYSNIRFYILSIAYSLVFWYYVRSLKYFISSLSINVANILWYMYYFAFIFAPLFFFFVSICVGHSESYKLDWKYRLLYIPATIMFALVMFNNRLKLAFVFDSAKDAFLKNYSYGILYYVIAVWVFSLFMVSYVILLKKYRFFERKMAIYIIVPVALSLLYNVLFHTVGKLMVGRLFDVTTFHIMIMVAIVEGIMEIGLIPSNNRYLSMFRASHIDAYITDNDGNVKYSSKVAKSLSLNDFNTLRDFGDTLRRDNFEYHIFPINGGYIVWQEDIGELNEVIDKLKNIERSLMDSSNLLSEEINVKRKLLKLAEQGRIYNVISSEIANRVEIMKRFIAQVNAGECNDDDIIIKMNILGAFIKRRSNLILMSEAGETLTVDELERCFEESLQNVKLLGIDTALHIRSRGEISAESAKRAYDFFEDVIRNSYKGLQFMIITVERVENSVKMRIGLENDSGYEKLMEVLALEIENIIVECDGELLWVRYDA